MRAASSGVNSVAKVTQTDRDLSGFAIANETSLKSCKSNSPVDKSDANIDFPNEKQWSDDNGNAKDRTSCNINKLNESHDDNDDFSPEIEGGNVVRRKKVVDEVKKIDSPSLKNKLELARKSFSSKLKLPNSLSHLAPLRRSLPNKLSLSQLERQNNLFIRDGQQQQKCSSVADDKSKINKVGSNSQNNTIISVVMEHAGGNNLPKSKKSLIPSFLSTTASAINTKSISNHIKIQSASTSIKKAPNVVEKLTKSGNKFREIYREKQQQTNLKRIPPPYRPPPTPPTTINSNSQNKHKKSRLTENVARNYEEIDLIVEENVQEIESNNENISSVGVTTQAIIHISADNNDSNIDNMLAKAEYSSNVFKNIPVRPRKGGAVAHMEHYCLFDPSIDFCNEKELMKKALTQPKIPITEIARKFPFNLENEEEKIEDVTFEDQTVYDITEHDERVAHHNYYEIDPELMEKEEAVPDKKSKMSSSSDSTSTSNTSANSSSTTTSSSDYPSLFNSVIETTHSSNLESTDDNDSNDYGKCQAPKINLQNLSNESIITVQNVVTACDASTSTSTSNGVKAKKKAPQLDRIIRAGPSSSTLIAPGAGRNKQYPMTKTKSSKTNKILSQLDPLKQSHSLPQLQNVIVQNKCRQQGSSDKSEISFVIENTTPIQLRRSRQQGRPLSTTSDDRDSGFLSPVTPPDCPQNVIEQGSRIKYSTMLDQSDNIAIQQLIEVSH